jgi:hypothetical protein
VTALVCNVTRIADWIAEPTRPPAGNQATSAPSAPPTADPGKITNRVVALALGRNGCLPSASWETGAHSARSVRCCWGRVFYGVQSAATTRRSVPGAMRSMAGMTFV